MDPEIERHISLIKATYSPRDLAGIVYGNPPPEPEDYRPSASFSFFLNRSKFTVKFQPTLGPTGPAVKAYMEDLQKGRKIHGQEINTRAREPDDTDNVLALPLEDELFREIMKHSSPHHDGTSSEKGISKILQLRPDLFKVDRSIPPLPHPGTAIPLNEYQSLKEVLYPDEVQLFLKSRGVTSSLEGTRWSSGQIDMQKGHSLPPEHPHFSLYPQIPRVSVESIKVIPYSDPRAILRTVIVNGSIMLFSPFRSGLIGNSIYYRPVLEAGAKLSWAFFKAGSINESQSHRITRLEGYVVGANDGHVVGVLFEWRDTSRRVPEDLGPDFSYRLGACGRLGDARFNEGEERLMWESHVRWDNYLEL